MRVTDLGALSPLRSYTKGLVPMLFAAWMTGSAAQSASISAQVTADNNYGLYLGAPSALRLLGSDSDWRTVETFSGTASAGEYAYIAAWDLGGFQGMQASVVVSGGSSFPTNASTWMFTVLAPSVLPGWTPSGSILPTTGSLQAALTSATWTSLGAAAPGTSAPWNMTTPIGSAQWVWSDSLGEVSTSDGQLVVFRTSSALVSAVPEVPSSVLLACGLAAGLLMKRRQRPPKGSGL